MSKIKDFFINKLLGSFKGYRTLIINAITLIVGLWTMLAESGLYDIACNITPFFCNFSESEFFGGVVTFIALLNKALRFMTTSPVSKK